MYSINSLIRFKNSMLKSNLCDYSDAYILAKSPITVPDTLATAKTANNTHKKAIIKTVAPFSKNMSKIQNKTIQN